MLEAVFLLPMQEFQKLAGKCHKILLLEGIEGVWDPPDMKLLQS
jgi:hypothetical protein